MAAETTTHEPTTSTDRSDLGAGYRANTGMRTSMEMQQAERLQEAINEGQTSGDVSKSPKKGNWFKRFSTRRKSKNASDMEKDDNKPFVGGAALAGASSGGSVHSAQHSEVEPATNESAVAAIADDEGEERGRKVERPISPVSSLESEDAFEEARDNFDEGLAPPPTFSTEKSSSPSRASKFTEVV